MNSTMSWLCGFAAGAAAVYFLDPVRGQARRALVRDKAASWADQAQEYADKTARDLSHRAAGLMHETRQAIAAPASGEPQRPAQPAGSRVM
ncbi:MAG TPA: YtxH domain-containing protein [Gemmataceae bacterium]|nr:YtxH domain-containing protein [Gemmataceae bacterium]